jgi:hypothetical protein
MVAQKSFGAQVPLRAVAMALLALALLVAGGLGGIWVASAQPGSASSQTLPAPAPSEQTESHGPR